MAASVGVSAQAVVTSGQGPTSVTTTPSVTTQASGSFAIVVDGAGLSSKVTIQPTDSKSNAYTMIGTALDYPAYAGFGATVWGHTITGGSGHTWTLPDLGDGGEGTVIGLEIIGADNVESHDAVAITNGGSSNPTFTSPTISASAGSVLVCVMMAEAYFDSDPAASGWVLQQTYNGSPSSVQASVFTKVVSSPGNYSCTITTTGQAQGALLFIQSIASSAPATNTVTGTQSPSQPSEAGTVFQNLNYVAMTESPAAPTSYAQALEVAIPTWVATGTFGDGTTGSTQFPFPAGIVKGDILEAFCEAANQTVTVSATGGGVWTQAASSPQGTGTAGGTSATSLTRFWSRYDGVQTAPSFQCSAGNHVNGCIAAFRGCVPVGDPHHVNTGGVKSTSSTTTSITGSSTTKNNCLVVAVVSRMDDSNAAHYSGWTNANLSNVTEIADGGGTGGNGGGIGACCGGLATAGTYGATTATNATTTTNAFMTFALLGAESGSATVSHAEQSPAAPTQTTTLSGDSGASVAGVEGPDAATQTETLQTPNTVSPATQSPAAPTETGTSLQTNTVTAAQAPAAATQTETLSQSATVASTQAPEQPTETTTLLQPAVVTPAQAPSAPSEAATLAQQWVVAQQSPAAPIETGAPFQGSQVTGIGAPAAATETETLSQYFVAGIQVTAPATQTVTVLQPSAVTAQQAPTRPSETGTSLQTSSVTGAEAPAAALETGQATQAAVVVGSETTSPAGQTETLAQGSGVVGAESPTQPIQTEAITQPSRVVPVQSPAQPIELLTLLQTSSVVALEGPAATVETATLQQGSLVDASQSPDEPEQTATLLQMSYVTGLQAPGYPIELLTLQGTSRVDALQGTSQPIEIATINTFMPAVIYGRQTTAAPSEWCTITTDGEAVTISAVRFSIEFLPLLRVSIKARQA